MAYRPRENLSVITLSPRCFASPERSGTEAADWVGARVSGMAIDCSFARHVPKNYMSEQIIMIWCIKGLLLYENLFHNTLTIIGNMA